MDWTGRTVVVTGASTGIGRAIAETLGSRGASLALCARDAAKLEAVAGALRRGAARVLALPCDVR
ncbi:MAG TPA: SDR family NAD(P)-dependent oxidoreductase, partial [Gemmatimonadales bacterium]|nr:SDR family NAD(P)-dependent oxidoreductase [Gemmatimonadales bacterium]